MAAKDRRILVFLRGLATWLHQGRGQAARPPEIEPDLEWHRNVNDPRENSKGFPPAHEELRTQAIWIVEVYPPSKVAGLATALGALPGDSWLAERERPSEWVFKARNQVRGWGGSLNLGYFVPTGAKGYPGVNYRVDLPEGIKYLRGSLHQLTPSITLGVFCFIFEEGSRLERAVEDSLRATYATVVENLGSTRRRYHTASNLRVAAARAARGELRAICEAWIAKTIPGFFSAHRERSGFTCEYITTLAQPLFERVKAEDGELGREGPSSEWLWCLHLDSPVEAWTSSELEGLRFGQSYANESAPNAWVIGGRSEEVLANDSLTKMSGDRTRGAIVGRIVLSLDNEFAVLGLTVFVREVSSHLASLRDKAARITIDRGVESAAELMKLQTQIALLNMDLLPVIDEVDLFAEEKHHWPRSLESDFVPLHEMFQKHGGLFANVRIDLQEHSRRLRLLSSSLREAVAVAATALHANIQVNSTAQNLALQNTMRRLTFVVIAIAVLSLFIGLPDAIGDWKVFLSEFWK